MNMSVNLQPWAKPFTEQQILQANSSEQGLVRGLVEKMSLEQKVQHLHGTLSFLTIMKLGWNYGADVYKFSDSEGFDVPPLHFTDGPRGVTLQGSTCFPVSMARGATFDVDLEQRIGNAIGIEARAHGASYFAGVCINLLRHPGWGRAQETYGEDTYHLGEMGAALTRSTQNHLMACVKHFAVNSVDNTRFKVNITIDERTLQEVYLPHFKRCIVDEKAASVMGAYNKLNGTQCCHHKGLLNEILREQWGFDGFVTSDWVYGIKDAAAGIEGGCDVEMPSAKHYKKLPGLVKKGVVDEKLLDQSVERVIRKKLEFATVGEASLYTKDKIGCKAHIALAREAAEKSLVLLTNKTVDANSQQKALPLQANTSIALIGKLAQHENLGDKGSSRVRPDYVVTIENGLTSHAPVGTSVTFDSGKKVESAVQLAEKSDVAVVVVGYTDKEEGEYMIIKGGDRKQLTLPKHDEKLIEAVAQTTKRVVVIMIGGSAIITESWKDKVSAIVMAWYPGMEGGNAIADLVYGNMNPSGKLPCSFPKSESQLPPFDVGALEMHYGYYHGYRLFDHEKTEPAFPFGFGLSYVDYQFSDLVIEQTTINLTESLVVKVKVKNTGDIAGEEVVQLYIGCLSNSVERFTKELKGFQRVQLQPGEEKDVLFTLDPAKLAYYDTQSKSWITELADYRVYVGNSSADKDLLKETFSIID